MSKIFDGLTRGGRILDLDTSSAKRPYGRFPLTSPSPNGFQRLDVKPGVNARLVFHVEPAGLAAEQYRLLRRRLAVRFPEGATLLVTSPGPGDGKTLNATNLSWCLAEGNGSTLLLEADLRCPTLARLLGCAVTAGVEQAFLGEIEPEAAVRKLGELPLYVAMASSGRPNPAPAFSGAGAKNLVAWAKSQFRWVVLDTPPVLPVADVGDLCHLADAVLLVVRARTTKRELILRSVELLGEHLQGVILNEATALSDSYYRYAADYYRYYTKNSI